jgi:hypothetical protein
MDDALAKRGRSLEEAFFVERNAQLIAQRKKLEEMTKTKEALAQVSGITNPKVLDKLAELGVSPSLLASLTILPLVEVAWADGELDMKERKAVLDASTKGGLAEGTIDYAILHEWLKQKPSSEFLEAWLYYIAGIREVLNPQELADLKSELLGRTRKVAEAAGGFLGVSKVSPEEQAILKKMEDAFKS